MKNTKKVLWIVVPLFIATISLCIFSVQRFEDIVDEHRYGTRYKYGEQLFQRIPPTPSTLSIQLNNEFKNLVSQHIKGQISVIDLASITTFEWDRVYIFGDVPFFIDYTDIDHLLGKSWRNIESCDYAAVTAATITTPNLYLPRGEYTIFVFMNESIITQCLFYQRILGVQVYTNSIDTETGIAREDAFFIIDKEHTIRPIEK